MSKPEGYESIRAAESLLPGTEPLPCGTLEIVEYRGKWLVRLRSLDGGVKRQTFPRGKTDEAFALFLQWTNELKREAQTRIKGETP